MNNFNSRFFLYFHNEGVLGFWGNKLLFNNWKMLCKAIVHNRVLSGKKDE